jgi:histidinol-phosphatase (PHP family)
MRTNYHTHTHHCDGKAAPEEFVLAAIAKGFDRLGFSGHAPVPFPTDWTMPPELLQPYLSSVRELQARYRGRLRIDLGLEVDFLPGRQGPRSPHIRALGLDFTLGSVHYITDPPRADGFAWTGDGSAEEFERGLREEFGGDARRLVERYYQRVGQLAEESPPDIFSHLDVVKRNNRGERWFSEREPWYHRAVRGALERIARTGRIVELNTGGVLRGMTDAFYPSDWILAECLKLGIPVMVNADAHRPEDLDGLFDQAYALLHDLGFRSPGSLRFYP